MSPIRVVLTVLAIVFATETAVMLGLIVLFPHGVAGWVESLLDATLLTLLIAPLMWWTIARPLRREAVAEHAKAESIVGAAAEGIITIDERGRIEMFNRAAEGIFGYPAAEVVGHDVAILLPENVTRQYAEGLQHFLATGESPLHRPDDRSVRPQEERPLGARGPVADGRPRQPSLVVHRTGART